MKHIAILCFTLFLAVTPLLSHAQEQKPSLSAGRFTLTVSSRWRVLAGAELEALKSALGKAEAQNLERYKKDLGFEPMELGIQHYSAAELSGKSGWCVVFEIRIPPQKDYYAPMKEHTQRMLEWGIGQGTIQKVIENGIVTISGKEVLKTTFEGKAGGRTTTIAFWSPSQPSLVTNIMISQNHSDPDVARETTEAITTLTIK